MSCTDTGSCTDPGSRTAEYSYSPRQQQQMLALARQSIICGATQGHPIAVTPGDYDPDLQKIGCCFVTLHLDGQLRGCIGALSATKPLIEEVAQYAYAAAFQDPRFSPVTESEIDQLQICISILTPQEELHFNSQDELLQQLTPTEDGLSIEANNHGATFLPAVWESLPDKTEFLHQLKLKAGLPGDYWSNQLRAFRYHTITVSE